LQPTKIDSQAREIEKRNYGQQRQTFSRRFSLEDPFGHKWTISHHVEDVSAEEIKQSIAASKKKNIKGAQP